MINLRAWRLRSISDNVAPHDNYGDKATPFV